MAAWARRQDRAGRLELVPYQEAPWPPMTRRLYAACARSMHVITPDGRVLRAGRGSLCVLGVLGWRRAAAILSLPPLIWLVEIGYRVVANNRRFFSRFFRGEC